MQALWRGLALARLVFEGKEQIILSLLIEDSRLVLWQLVLQSVEQFNLSYDDTIVICMIIIIS